MIHFNNVGNLIIRLYVFFTQLFCKHKFIKGFSLIKAPYPLNARLYHCKKCHKAVAVINGTNERIL
jgi:hypothetical protein